MNNRSRKRMAAIIGVSVAAGTLGAIGVNSSAWADNRSPDSRVKTLVIQLQNPVGSLYINGTDERSGGINNGFCVRGPLQAGEMTTPYRVQNLTWVKLTTFSDNDCTNGYLKEQQALVPGDDNPYFTVTVN